MAVRRAEVQFPVGGLVRSLSYQKQAPYTTPDCNNVWPRDTISRRLRGGSRAGLRKWSPTELGSGTPVRMLSGLRLSSNTRQTVLRDDFDAGMGDNWLEDDWSDGLPMWYKADTVSVDYVGTAGALYVPITDLDVVNPYSVEIFCVPYRGDYSGSYRIWLRMDDSDPQLYTDGVQAQLTMAGGVYSGQLTVWVSGVSTSYNFTGGDDGAPLSGWFKVLVNTNTVTVYWNNKVLLTQAISAAAGKRVGFGMICGADNEAILVDTFRVIYRPAVQQQGNDTILLASAGGVLYKEGDNNAMETVSTSLTIAPDRSVDAKPIQEKLWIADHGTRIVVATADIDVTGLEVSDSGVSDWTTYGIDPHDDVVEITNVTGGAVAGVYKITSVAASKVTLTASAGTTGTADIRIVRGLKVYDPSTDALSLVTASAGIVPVGCPLIAVYREALVLGGPESAPSAWFISRQGTPDDFDYAATDVQGAVAGTNTDAGQISEPLTCLAAWMDDYFIMGCRTSLWIMRGHPRLGGGIIQVSSVVGVVDQRAWTFTPEGDFIFLSHAGVYALPRGATSAPLALSDKALPEEFQGFLQTGLRVGLTYDPERNGIHIFQFAESSAARKQWFFDLNDKGFWPGLLDVDHEPATAFFYDSQRIDDQVNILGCRDGYLRRFDDTSPSDDGVEFTSYCDFGPLRLSGTGAVGTLTGLSVSPAEDGQPITATVRSGFTPELAFRATARFTQEFNPSRYRTWTPRAGGGAVVLRFSGSAPWSLDGAVMEAVDGGRMREP